MFSIVDLVFICLFTVIYAWALYNLPIIAAGVRNVRKNKLKPHVQNASESKNLPSFSIIVPAKNEGKTIDRLFKAFSKLNYPKGKVEIIIVEDGSKDDTFRLCNWYAEALGNVKVFHPPYSNGKPSALNFGLKQCKGDLVAVFDADNVPAPDVLLKAAKYFEDSSVAAVQGRTMSINAKENMLTQFVSYEEAVWCEAYLRGKDCLGLFVHLKGSCQFIRRNVLQKLSGFDESTLSEDMELSARLAENGYGIRYAGDVCAWQESPSSLKTLFRQRTRWFRGTMEVAFKYGRLMAKPCKRNFDAEVTLLGPFIIIASLLSFSAASGALFASYPFDILWRTLSLLSLVSTIVMFLLAGAVLVFMSKPKRVRNLLWLPFVFSYWCLQAFIALYAAMLIVLRRPRVWLKTEKNGTVTNSDFVLETQRAYEKVCLIDSL
jgi:cellulose synthase/poly-beta-1,6-N-acetylglucosamine synthase-like glycosyltransferase